MLTSAKVKQIEGELSQRTLHAALQDAQSDAGAEGAVPGASVLEGAVIRSCCWSGGYSFVGGEGGKRWEC